MRVDLLGTGSADRWPNPWCACERCHWARDAGVHRGRTSALVDGCLLIDPGPDAGSGGVDLTGVRTVLVTHDHPDHLDPAFLLAWSWASGPGLLVAGPPDAIERCRAWVGPDAPVEFRSLSAGDELVVGELGRSRTAEDGTGIAAALDRADGHGADAVDGEGTGTNGVGAGRAAGHPAASALRIRALPAAHSTAGGREHDGTALLFEVASTDATLLYATDTAALPHEALAASYDLVLLELTFGDRPDHGTAHLDLPSFGHEVARLRGDGRLAKGARVVAVHLSHHNPIDLPQRLAAIGAEVARDGTALQVGSVGRRMGRRLLVTGGARSGKSHHAESLARGRAPVTYLATAPTYPDDPDWVERIARHRDRRPPSWRLRETTQVADMLREAEPDETVLVDCLTLWVMAAVDRADGWEDTPAAAAAVEEALTDLLDALGRTQADVVLVTNEVGSGIAPATASGRLFRDLLGGVNTAVATACDDVVLVTSGIPRTLKGRSWTSST